MGKTFVLRFSSRRNMKAFAVVLALLPLAANVVRSQNYYYKSLPDQARSTRSNPPPPPAYAPAPGPYLPATYNFAWDVLDTYSGNDFGHQEERNDKLTTGSYHVALPDGRVQRVTYTVDGYGGYAAEVTYDGEAAYPDTPAYVPAPAPYKPAPVYAKAESIAAPVVVKTVEPAPEVKTSEPVPVAAPAYKPAPVVYKPAPVVYKPAPAPAYKPRPVPGHTARRYSYKVVEEPEAPVAEESRSVAGRPVANVIEAAAVKEEEEDLAAAIRTIESNDPAQAVEASAPVEEEEEPVVTTIATPASYYYRFY